MCVHDQGLLSEIRGLPSINRFLESAVEDPEHELLTAPPAGARRAVIPQQAMVST